MSSLIGVALRCGCIFRICRQRRSVLRDFAQRSRVTEPPDKREFSGFRRSQSLEQNYSIVHINCPLFVRCCHNNCLLAQKSSCFGKICMILALFWPFRLKNPHCAGKMERNWRKQRKIVNKCSKIDHFLTDNYYDSNGQTTDN